MLIEIKRYAKVSNALLQTFWKQAVNQAECVDKVPVLLFREDRQEWQSVIPLYQVNPNLSKSNHFDNAAILRLPAFCGVIREGLK